MQYIWVILIGLLYNNAYATHISQPIITTEEGVYYSSEPIIIEGFVEYQESPTSNVLLEIDPNGLHIKERFTTSNSDGYFRFELEPSKAGKYNVKIISHCREEHRNICKNRETTINIEVRDNIRASDDRIEIIVKRIYKLSSDVEIIVNNKYDKSINIDLSKFYLIDNDNIYLSNIQGIISLAPFEDRIIRLDFTDYTFNNNDPLLVYDDGISMIRVPEFPIALIIFAFSLLFIYLLKVRL